jgi:predicted Fe-Mo cluster-binding NifX family protein
MPKFAFTVARNEDTTPLSPFFGKADWLLIVDPTTGRKSYIANRGWTSDWVCTTALAHAVDGLACAYIDTAALRRLTEAGVEVRLASCARPATELVDEFARLPLADGGVV